MAGGSCDESYSYGLYHPKVAHPTTESFKFSMMGIINFPQISESAQPLSLPPPILANLAVPASDSLPH
jgi:hypothetical protein